MLGGIFSKNKIRVQITKTNGAIFVIQAMITSKSKTNKEKMLFVEEKDISPNILEAGDVVKPLYSNGLVEEYEIVEPNYFENVQPIPNHYQASIISLKNKEHNVQYQNIQNMGNGNLIINSNSPNTSIEITQSDSKFEEIKKVIQENNDIINKKELIDLVDELSKSTNDKETFTEKYNKFITSLASHITILTPFLPYLIKFMK